MAEFRPEQIRNISLIGHGGSGKTILTEGILYTTGVINRFGKIEEGNTVSDFNKDEIEKQLSINSSLMNTVWKDSKGTSIKINMLDTPGFMDYIGDVIGALRVTDTTLVLVDAFKGVEVGTEISFKHTKKYNNNIIFVVNKLDTENANFEDAVKQIKESFGNEVAVAQFPVDEGLGFHKIIDLIRMKQLTFDASGKGEYKEEDIPEELKAKAEQYRQNLIEAIASEDESLMEKFFEGGLTEDDIVNGMKTGMKSRKLFPVFCTAAVKNIGVRSLLDFLCDYTVSPVDKGSEIAYRPGTTDEVEVKPDIDGDPVLLVFKTMSERNVGEFSFFRMYSGKVSAGMDLLNSSTGKIERLSQIYSMNGNERKEMTEAICGDIAAVVKLKDTHTNNTLCSKNNPVELKKIEFPEPNMTLAVFPKRKGEEDKMGMALHSFHEEDPTFMMTYDTEINQSLIHGQGEIHLATIINRMKNKFNIEVETAEPRIPYRETIKSKAKDIEYKHKKQTGGRGQFGHVVITLEPTGRGEGFEFVDEIVGGVIPGRFIPAVEKGIIETMENGVLVGSKVIDVRVRLTFGSYHTVDSDELSFKLAASQAFKKGFKEANPILLEPIYNVEITFPEEFMGAVSGDISSRRGKILGMETEGRLQVIKATIPLSEMSGYSSKLRSFTQGRGTYTRKFSHYEEVPKEVEAKIIAEYEKQRAEENK
jgi:elongation factor G